MHTSYVLSNAFPTFHSTPGSPIWDPVSEPISLYRHCTVQALLPLPGPSHQPPVPSSKSMAHTAARGSCENMNQTWPPRLLSRTFPCAVLLCGGHGPG